MSNLVWIFKEIFYLGATASILILIILLIKKIFGKALNPKWHYYIWVLLFIKLLIPFYTESSISVYNLFYTAAEKVNMHIGEIGVPFKGNSLNENSTNTKVVSSTHAITDINNVNTANDDNIKVTKSPKYSSAMLIIAFIWVIGVLMLSFYIIYINIAFTINVNRKYTLLKNERIRTILEDCKNAMKVKYPISLLTSKEIRMPSLYGLFKAKILISESYMDKLSDTEIRYIFLHELSHYKGKDIAINGILCLLQIIYFFNPLIWYAFYKIHEDCEISCDAAALRYIDEAEYNNYGSTIIKLIRLFSESNFIPLTAGISKKNSSYKRRIIMINKFKKSKWTSSLLAVILIISTGLVGLTGCNLSKDEDSNTNTMTSSNSTNNTKNQTTTDGTNSPDFNTSDSTKPNETSKPRDTDTTNPSQTTTAA
ncbi:MAG TPA: M56 family metallopeptidase, partial [Ruminiclostridium sp.]